MRQEEINEISQAFLEAWEEFFGAPMYYIPFDETSSKHSIYNESKGKKYKEDEAVMFHGTIKERENQDVTKPTGKRVQKVFELTAVTKELIDGGIEHIDTNSIIRYTDQFGKVFTLSIYDDLQKVQLTNNKIFTKMKVVYHE